MDDDDFEDDSDFLAVLAASGAEKRSPKPVPQQPPPQQRIQQQRIQQQPDPQRLDQQPPPPPPLAQRIQQPFPQRLDQQQTSSPQRNQAGLMASAPNPAATGVVQPKPQALPQRSAGSSILVSPRQRGNPVLTCLRSQPWEYSDIAADYVMGATTCALFLSLKYHRLHPEYIYTRIRNLQGKYNLRVLLTLVDIPNHEDALRELAKASLVNNATLILCWSPSEAARYLELYKACEHAGFSAIRGQQTSSYGEKLVEFVTVPRSINKADAVALVSNFGSLRNAVNAGPDQLGIMGGWGEVKVKRWCAAVEEPFRANKDGWKATKTTTTTTTTKTGQGAPLGDGQRDNTAATIEGELKPADVSVSNPQGIPAVPAATVSGSADNTDPADVIASKLAPGVAAALARLRENG